ncbi:MAG TPA: CocE/NonD family hydrolase [Blastocatellia bacterium]|nr:CocE/NonD family hydrolase [Blastocatellia bacterium]
MSKYAFMRIAVCVGLALLLLPCPRADAQFNILVKSSTHFIEVPASADSPDGPTISLAATLYQPRFFPSAPAVIYIHGWGGRRLMGEDNLAYYIAASGYTVLSYSARGFGDGESGGHVTLAGPDELSDLSRVIDWLLNDPEDTISPRVGKVGVIGGSYGGGHGFQIASDPRVSAVIPLIGWTDLEQALYPNGATNYRQGIGQFYGGLKREQGAPPFYNYDRLQFEMFDAAAEGRAPTQFVKDSLRARSVATTDASGRSTLKAARMPRAPIFIIHSWDDYLFPAPQVLDIYSQITAPKQIYLGRRGHPPGGHDYDGEEAVIAAQVLRWFDHHLRGIGGTDSRSVTSAPAPFFWEYYTSQQLGSSDTAPLALYLKAGGQLSRKKKGPTQQEVAGGVFRPQRLRSSRLGSEVPARADMFSATVDRSGSLARSLVYTFAPWASDTQTLGLNEFNLYLSSGTSSVVDVIVRTFDVAPDGTETEVTVGVIRVDGLAPGEVRRVTFRDYGDNWIFRAGHSLRLKLTNIDFPDFRPPGVNDNLPSEITLHYGKQFPSSVRVPVLKN